MQIKHRDGRTLFEGDYPTVADAVKAAIISSTSLQGANLRDADLQGANLQGADLWDADLQGANLHWQSHDLIAAILLQSAGVSIPRRMLAGLVLVSRDWCWKNFLTIESAERSWALESLRPWAEVEGGNPPVELLVELKKI